MNLVTGRALRPIRLQPVFAGFDWSFVISPNGRTGYAQLGDQSWVQPVNLVSGTALRPVSMPPGHPTAGVAAFAPSGDIVYIGAHAMPKHQTGELIPIQTATQRVGKPIHTYGTAEQIVVTG